MTWMIVLIGSILAGAAQTITGFGAGIVMMLFLPYCMNLLDATALSAVICLGLTAALAWQYRKRIRWDILLLPALSYIGAQSVAVRLVKSIDLSLMTTAFGVFLILLVVFYAFFSQRVVVRHKWYVGLAIGLFSGVCGGLFGFGPMIALYLLPLTEDREEYIASTQLLFACANAASIAARLAGGIFPLNLLPLAVLGIMGINAGKLAGLKIGARINEKRLTQLIYIFIALSGVITILKQVL